MLFNSKSFFVIIVILILGSLLYLYKIDRIPPGLAADEITNGYNAYSILLTGKDEFGKAYPIFFRFYNAYSPPLYTYLTVPAIFVLGLNVTAIRIVSVMSGFFSIMVIFLLLKNLNVIHNRRVIYLGVLLYTISPWAVVYSRSGYEAMLSFFIYYVGILLLWEGLKKPLCLTLGVIVLSVSVYASYANKLLIPILLICLILIFKNVLFNSRNRKYLIIGLIVAFIIQLPGLSVIFTRSSLVKSEILYNSIVFSKYQEIEKIVPPIVGIPYLYIREFLSQYLTYFSVRSLFLDPDPFPVRSIPNLSVFYPWMFIPYLIGVFVVWKKRALANYKFLLVLAVTAPIPAALARDPFWTYRAIPLLAPLIIIIAVGIDRISKLKIKLFIPLCCLIVIYSLILLWRGYFIFLPNEKAIAWEYGYQNLAEEITTYKNEHFVIDNARKFLVYLQLAFFMKLPPQMLQNAVSEEIRKDYYNNTMTNSNYSFENVEVRNIAWKTDIYKNQILVGDSLTFSDEQIRGHQLTQIFQIKDSMNNIVFEGYKTNPLKVCENLKVNNLPLDPMCRYLYSSKNSWEYQ